MWNRRFLSVGVLSCSLVLLCYTLIAEQSLLKESYFCGSAATLQQPEALVQVPTAQQQDKKDRAILFVHFHKSGGSEVCGIMRRARVNMTDMMGQLYPRGREGGRNANCNTELSGPNNNVQLYARMQTCRMLESYTMNEEGVAFTRFNFLAIEVPFLQRMPCPGFRSFAIMREPVSRLLSHIRVHHTRTSRIRHWVHFKNSSSEGYYMNGYPVINNFVIRMLLGRERYIDTTTPITQEDFQQAKLQVDAFDAFIPLEHQDHPNVLSLLKERIPEYHDGYKNRVREHQGHQSNRTEYDEEFMELLVRENSYDIKLYNYVLEKFGISKTEE